mmetsp:Transcript_4517/g.12606  ORF Transcript_4517/g.12606 Transcript_4517/m.12606 type:complete len:316 (+) Transcript_4517:906-1853(+)
MHGLSATLCLSASALHYSSFKSHMGLRTNSAARPVCTLWIRRGRVVSSLQVRNSEVDCAHTHSALEGLRRDVVLGKESCRICNHVHALRLHVVHVVLRNVGKSAVGGCKLCPGVEVVVKVQLLRPFQQLVFIILRGVKSNSLLASRFVSTAKLNALFPQLVQLSHPLAFLLLPAPYHFFLPLLGNVGEAHFGVCRCPGNVLCIYQGPFRYWPPAIVFRPPIPSSFITKTHCTIWFPVLSKGSVQFEVIIEIACFGPIVVFLYLVLSFQRFPDIVPRAEGVDVCDGIVCIHLIEHKRREGRPPKPKPHVHSCCCIA